jgi:hypothetical protein
MAMHYSPNIGGILQYLADAEVEAKFRTGLEPIDAFRGEVFEFRFPRIDLQKIGHLDSHQPQPGSGWVRQTGNTYVCLYQLALDGRRQTPGGQPFELGDSFEIWTTHESVGEGVVTRLTGSNQSINLCRPIGNENADAFASRPENGYWAKVRDTPAPGLPAHPHMEAMRSAVQKVCEALLLKYDAYDPIKVIIVDKIIALANAGEHDADRLASKVLKELADDAA